MKKLICLFLSLISINCFAEASSKESCETNGVDYAKATQFVTDFQNAIKNDDKDKVADLATYPLKINKPDANEKIKSYEIKDKQEFISKYDDLFNKDMKKNLLKDPDIFCNYNGGMIANGAIWFETNNKSAGFYVINLE